MIRLVSRLFFRIMARYEHLPSDECLSIFRGRRIWELEPEWQVAYLEYVYRLDASRHYQQKPE